MMPHFSQITLFVAKFHDVDFRIDLESLIKELSDDCAILASSRSGGEEIQRRCRLSIKGEQWRIHTLR
jgi:hypothetical protein